MAASLPRDFRLQPTDGTAHGGGRLEGGTPRTRVELTPEAATTVEALLAGEPLGDVPGPEVDAVARRLLDLDLAIPRPTGSEARTLRVAAVVPARNAAATLPVALAGLAGVSEVIVVDDGSTDDTARVAAEHGATVLHRSVAGGPAAARNAGAATTRADVVVFLDADTESDPGWVDRLLVHFDDPAVGGAAPRVRSTGGRSAVARYESVSGALDLGSAPGLVRPDGRITFVSTTALAVRREAFLAIGGFAEDLRFGEDLDFVWRLWAAGRPVVYEPSVEVRHRHRPSLRAHLVNQFRYATASGPLRARHDGVPSAGRAEPLVALGVVAFLLGAHRSGAALAAGGAVRTAQALRTEQASTPAALRTAGRASLGGARNVAASVSRPWLPLAVAVAVVRRRARSGVALALGARWLLQARRSAGSMDWVALRVLEDAAHSAGAIRGCITARRLGPLLPGPLPGPASTRSVLGQELTIP
jgi:mycofactocin system glycosyltransferase